ncbi:restriction endonuclease subunit S [Magnetovibrio sp.]|uniref:restriction endonuclease subunit S n=1 Tax=Magnetovibrio sp. TaxID=2024836 RepID=UPI002F950DC6
MSVRHKIYPDSVKHGIPTLGPLRPGWQRFHIGDLFEEALRPVQMDDQTEYDLITVKRSRGGAVKRETLLGRDIAVKTQFRVEANDFLISKRQIVHGACAVVPPELAGSIVSNEYAVLRCRSNIDIRFLNYLSHSIYFQETCFHSSIGVHVEKMIFKLADWFNWEIDIPVGEEQQQIIDFLSSVDHRLSALRRKRSLLEDYKRGVMQQIFSQEIRFKRKDGKNFPMWEERELGKIGKTYGGLNGKSANDFGDGFPFVTYTQIFRSSYVQPDDCGLVRVGKNENQNEVRVGDVLFTASSETPDEVGYASAVCTEIPKTYLNSFSFGFRPNKIDDLIPEFSRYLFRSNKYRALIFPLAQGITRYNISKSSFLKLKLCFPHPDEQRKIADFLSAIDAKIDAVAGQANHTETYKKGLLQQMFV